MKYPYQDTALNINDRVEDLIQRMTHEEKYAQLGALWLELSPDGIHRLRGGGNENKTTARCETEKLAGRLKLGVGQITRPLGTQIIDAADGTRARNQLQREIINASRLGIPALFHEECLVGLMCAGATLFPSPLNHGAAWDTTLTETVAGLIGREARSVGCHQGLAPVLDVSRDVRWGRTEETFGEDPYFVGLMGVSYVRGLQGHGRDLLATLKHFVAHSFSEGARNHAPVHIGFRELNDTFLLPFEMAVKLADAGAVMPAYHDIDGKPLHCDTHLLTDVLRGQWKFDGLIVADYGGVSLLHEHHGVSSDPAESAAQAFNAGLDAELPQDDCSRYLPEAVNRGLISMATVDKAVKRVLREKFRLGLFECPFVDEKNINFQCDEARKAANILAIRSLVLLENDGILPLSPAAGKRIAVIGPTANDPLALLSGYSFPVHLIISEGLAGAQDFPTPLAALRECYGEENVLYACGCDILKVRVPGSPVFPGDMRERVSSLSISRDTSQIQSAVKLAAESDIAVVCVGDLPGLFQSGTVGEGSDTDSLQLPGVQQTLLQAVISTGIPTVVIMTGGRPYNLCGLEKSVAAFIMAFEPGQEGGKAIADFLSGKHAPYGRLPVSVPKSAGAMPYYYNHRFKSGGAPVAFHFGSLYPFGYGKTWTTFAYSALKFRHTTIPAEGGTIEVEVIITNTGNADGSEVVQLYVRDPVASLVRPLHELRAFQRIQLSSGQSALLLFAVPTDLLSFTDINGERIIESGEFEIQIGASSEDIRASGRIEITGEKPFRVSGKWRMVSDCKVSYL